jgi:PAS domain S-box-containing protein
MDTVKYLTDNFESIYENASLPVIMFDNKANLIRANQAFLDLAGASETEIKSLAMTSLFKNLKPAFERELIMDYQPDHTTSLSTLEGHTIPVRIYYSKLINDTGTQDTVLSFIINITDIHNSIEQIRELDFENRKFKEQLTGKTEDTVLSEKINLEKNLIDTRIFVDSLLESYGDGIIIMDCNGKILQSNESFTKMLGKSKEQITGKLVYEIGGWSGEHISTTGETIMLDQSYTDYQTSMVEKIQKLIEGAVDKVENWEYYMLNSEDKLVPLELTVSAIKNEEGNITATVASARDLTKKRIAEKELKASRDFLENIIEASHDCIVVSRLDGTILLANSQIEKITGFSKEEFIGSKFSDIVKTVNPSAELHSRTMEELNKNSKISFETFIKNKNGDMVYLEHGIALIHDEKDNDTLAVSIIRDITEKKKAAQKLQDAYQFRNKFFTNITHAFRTPLTLLIGPLEGILRGEFGKTGKELDNQLAISLRNSKQLLKLINQLLDFSQVESGRKKMTFVEKDLEKMISSILDSFTFISKKKKIKLTFAPGKGIPYITLDPVKMEKALFNILGNAFKFTPENGNITDTTENAGNVNTDPGLSEKLKNSAVKISITDTGIGIKKENLKQIFDRFIQENGDFIDGQVGTGIGLAHSKELIELMGGWITAQSEYGKGSTFSIYLPLDNKQDESSLTATANNKEDFLSLQPDVELSDIPLEKDVLLQKISGTKPLILVIDDNPDVRNYISAMLNKDYDYMTARNGIEGLKQLSKYMPDIILCDIMMPKMDGHEFLKKLKGDSAFNDISLIFLTARADTEMKIEGLEQGADDYIVKPFNSLELLARIRSLLRIRSLTEKNKTHKNNINLLTQKLQNKYSYENIVGNSPAMRKIYQALETIMKSHSTVLISGETGTGKELIANAIHYNSPRREMPLITVNCGAIPGELIESEFFGHSKGAFTGAVESRTGHFQEAHKGTLFLDEIGEMSSDMQVKLLRVLEKGEVTRVGDSIPSKVDVRLIAATNKDLLAEVRNGNFREDLFYRIFVIPIHVPPLRERKDDIPLLIEHFLDILKLKQDITIPPLNEKEMRLFINYSFPGNVRELEHIVERFCLLGGNAENLFIERNKTSKPTSDFPYDELLSSSNPLKTIGMKAKASAEKDLIMHVLQICDNDYNKAAKILDIGISSLYRKLKEPDQESI